MGPTTNIYKHGSKHTGSKTNIQAKIGGTYERIKTEGLYIQEGKNIIRQRY